MKLGRTPRQGRVPTTVHVVTTLYLHFLVYTLTLTNTEWSGGFRRKEDFDRGPI